MDNDMWIMIIEDLPIENPPPIFSIFWGKPYIDTSAVKQQSKLLYPKSEGLRGQFYYLEGSPEDKIFYTLFGKEANELFSLSIDFEGEKIKVYSHEYTPQSQENMDLFIKSDDSIFELVPDSVSGKRLLNMVLDLDYKPVYEAALMDGCSENLAQLVALGEDFSTEYPPVGWYKPNPRIYQHFIKLSNYYWPKQKLDVSKKRNKN